MRILIARIAGVPARVAMAVDLAAASLRQAGHDVADFDVPSRGLPPGLDDEQRRLGALFTLTPGALIESWRVARYLEAASEPGDTVVVTDHRGLGGVFALEQRSQGRGEAVHVWTIAGESIALHHLDTLGTLGGYAGETESAIDWELVQYRSSAATITPAARVVEHSCAKMLAPQTRSTLARESPLKLSTRMPSFLRRASICSIPRSCQSLATAAIRKS